MKTNTKFWIYMGLDGDMYFGNPKRLYNYAIQFDHKPVSYQTFLKKLRDKDRQQQIFNNGADARIDYIL